MKYRMTFSAAAIALAVSSVAMAQTPDTKPVRIRGEIVSVAGDTLVVHRRSGDDVEITLKADAGVNTVKNVKLADIKKGSYVGIASKTGVDGKLTAQEVVVFPEAARGTGEGHYAWDLTEQSTMTNANVDTVVEGSDGRNLKLSYKGGTNDIVVPENVPVVTVVPAAKSDLVKGKKVFVSAVPNGTGKYSANRIVVEKDGVAPPM